MNSYVYIMFHGDFVCLKNRDQMISRRPQASALSSEGRRWTQGFIFCVNMYMTIYDYTISDMFNKAILIYVDKYIYILY